MTKDFFVKHAEQLGQLDEALEQLYGISVIIYCLGCCHDEELPPAQKGAIGYVLSKSIYQAADMISEYQETAEPLLRLEDVDTDLLERFKMIRHDS